VKCENEDELGKNKAHTWRVTHLLLLPLDQSLSFSFHSTPMYVFGTLFATIFLTKMACENKKIRM